MFESSLIDLEVRQKSRRRWAALPAAIALHGVVLASVGVAQVWNVEAVADPQMVDPYVTCGLPLQEPSNGPATQRTVQKPRTQAQPDLQRLPDAPAPDAGPKTATGPVILDGPPSGGGGDDRDLGPGSSKGPTGPISVEAPAPVVPVAAPPRDEILTVGGAVTRPELLSGTSPRYSKIALRARIEGVVVLRAIIDERGFVTNVHILKGLPMGLDQAAVETVREWIFEPAKLAGRPVKVHYTLTVQFRL